MNSTRESEVKKKREKESEVREKMNIKIIYTVNSNRVNSNCVNNNRVYMHDYCLFIRLLYIFRQFYKD